MCQCDFIVADWAHLFLFWSVEQKHITDGSIPSSFTGPSSIRTFTELRMLMRCVCWTDPSVEDQTVNWWRFQPVVLDNWYFSSGSSWADSFPFKLWLWTCWCFLLQGFYTLLSSLIPRSDTQSANGQCGSSFSLVGIYWYILTAFIPSVFSPQSPINYS